MQLQKAIYSEIDSRTRVPSDRVTLLCKQAKVHEEAGDFEAARDTLAEFWEGVGERPSLDGLTEIAQAELLLRSGTLSGWIGSARQIPGAQSNAKDLITESSRIFENLSMIERVAECQVDLAICYWREGALDEARITLDDALKHLGDLESEQRLRIVLNRVVVEEVAGRSNDALRLLRSSEALFDKSSNDALKGKFHNQFANVLKNVGLVENRGDYIDQALVEYAAAGVHAERVGNKRVLASTKNNVGFLFVRLGRFSEAHEELAQARRLFESLKDRGTVAQVDDTRARAFIAQGMYTEAEKVSRAAVRVLEQGDERSLLASSLTTYATVLARTGRSKEALLDLNRAIQVAEQAGDIEGAGLSALTVIEELGSDASFNKLWIYYQKAESNLALSQQPAIRMRLGKSASKLISLIDFSVFEPTRQPSKQQDKDFENTGKAFSYSLDEEVRRYEGQLIKRALDACGGSVTRAARSLGITHQGLAFILNGRQKDLLSARTPIKPRRRSIIRYR